MLFLQSYEILWSGEHSLLPKSGSLGYAVRKSGLCSLWQVTGSPQPQVLLLLFFFLIKGRGWAWLMQEGHAESAGHALRAKY